MAQAPPVVLTIAGFDPSSGAGVTADIKTIAAHGCYGVACITALTVQTTSGVSRVEGVAPELVASTLSELDRDLEIAAIKIGMLGSAGVVAAVADFLQRRRPAHVVLDPVFQSTSGASLLDPAGRALLRGRLLPLCSVTTPNLDEAAELAKMPVTTVEEMKVAADRVHILGVPNVVVTGGHLEKAIDVLSFTTPAGKLERQIFKAQRQRSRNTHGTGCAFATAVACHLAYGRQLPEAVLLGKAYVTAAISHAYPLGRGAGPLHHLYRMHEPPRRPVSIVEPETAS